MDREVLLDALSELCDANVVALKKWKSKNPGKTVPEEAMLSTGNFLSKVFEADESSKGSGVICHRICITTITFEIDGINLSNSDTVDGPEGPSTDETQSQHEVPSTHQSPDGAGSQVPATDDSDPIATGSDDYEVDGHGHRDNAKIRKELIVNEDDFFDPRHDYDFTNVHDRKTYTRGGEAYRRPCGWNRLALKVNNKYPNGNDWLGTTNRSTSSEAGEWPVSYHGTTDAGAKGIITGHYMAGARQRYGRGVYSTPSLTEAEAYCSKSFICKATGKKYKVMLQNRINPEYREICSQKDYWLVKVPKGTSDEQKITEGAIRPYGLLLKAIK